MYRKILWCYIIVLTLLDISLNTKLSAQGKSHGNGVSVHESLMEGISLQEWGKEAGGGRAADALALSPPALRFGRAPLAAAHARTVTLTNNGNETIHLASVAGTTADFHASFFDSKTLVPQANTTFSVVYLGRREGPVSTHLFIHTSRGLLPYPVSAEGVASPWRVWPLVGLRVPINATLEPMLTLYNPTDTAIQVSEIYSSGSWLGLQLPGGGSAAPRLLWTVPAHAQRDLVRLRVQAPKHAHAHSSHAHHRAYIRIKANMTGGGLVVGVEAIGAAPGEYLHPPQLRLRTRGTRDPPDTFMLEAGNSDETPVSLEGGVWGARCGATPPDPPRPPTDPPPAHHTHNGGGTDSGAHVTLLRDRLEARDPPAPAAHLTLHYGAMWAGAGMAWGAGEAWCAGWARVGRAAAPYSLRLRPGTLALHPTELHFVTAAREEVLSTREVRAHNQFNVPVHIEHVDFPLEVLQHFHTESLAPVVLGAGASGAVARLRLRAADAPPLHATITLRTNITDYTLPLLLYEGTLHFEWEWGQSAADGSLELGVVSAGSRVRVRARLHNTGAAPLCLTSLHAALPPAAAALRLLHHAQDEQMCVEVGGHCTVELSVVAGEEPGRVTGVVGAHTAHAASTARVSMRVARGALVPRRVLLPHAAPHVRAAAPLLLDNSLEADMQVTHLAIDHAALQYKLPENESEREVVMGLNSIGELIYAMECECEGQCATGLELSTAEGGAWAARATLGPDALPQDEQVWSTRRDSFPSGIHNYTTYLHTTAARAVPVEVSVERAWPTLLDAPPTPPLAPVGVPGELRVLVHNPSVLPLALHAVVGGGGRACACEPPACAPSAWAVREWRVTHGAADPLPANPDLLLLQPAAEIELLISFTPLAPADLTACLYLRNNLTIVEGVPLRARGAHPAFELGAREPNSSAPILLEVSECGAGGAGTVRRAVWVRNTGAVAVRLREWRLAGGGCAARGFRLQPCGALALRPNESRALALHYTPDWTRARAFVPLSVRAGAHTAVFHLVGVAPAALVARCAPAAPRPPFEPALRALGAALAVLALVGAVALGALDAERALRRHRAARAAPPRAPPLDLRTLAAPAPNVEAHAPPPPPPPPVRRRRTPRRRAPHQDAVAERQAFERWRAGVARRQDDSRSSEDGDDSPTTAAPPAAPDPPSSSDSSPSAARRDITDRCPHSERQYSRRSAPEGASSGEESSAGSEHSARSEHSEHSERSEHSRSEHSRSEHSDRSEAEGEGREALPTPGSLPPDAAGDGGGTPPPNTYPKDSTSRRESGTSRAGRGGGAESRVRARSGSARSLGRKERVARRRRVTSPCAARAAATVEPRAPPAVRWGASWSSVVSRGAAPDPPPSGGPVGAVTPAAPPPLAPIGSDVRRRTPSHSLFYYGAPAELPWPERAPRPPPPVRPPAPPRPDYTGEESGGFRSLESVWGASVEPHPAPAAAAWLWGAPPAPPLRPPPGFAPRTYDPFQSLASIWTPTLEWRRRDRDPPPSNE